MPVAGGTTRNRENAFCPQRRKRYRSAFRSNSTRAFFRWAMGVP